MARDKRIRVSDEELSTLKSARAELFGEEAEHVPLGATVKRLAEDADA